MAFTLSFWIGASHETAAGEPNADPDRQQEEKLPAKLDQQIFTESLTASRSYSRAMISSRTNRFSFIIPPGFKTGKTDAGRKIVLLHPGQPGHLEIVIHEGNQGIVGAQSADSSGPGLEVSEKLTAHYRKIVTQRFPEGKIVDEFVASTGELAGPAFEIRWINDLQQSMVTRLAFVPFDGGVIEFTQQADASDIKNLATPFNSLLLTFRAGSGNTPPEMVRLGSRR